MTSHKIADQTTCHCSFRSQTPQTGLSSYAASSELPQSKSASKSEYVSGYEATGNKRQSSKQEETQPETEAITVFATKIRLPHSDEAKDWTEESSGELDASSPPAITFAAQSD